MIVPFSYKLLMKFKESFSTVLHIVPKDPTVLSLSDEVFKEKSCKDTSCSQVFSRDVITYSSRNRKNDN